MTSLRGEERTEFPQSVRKAAFRRCCKPDGVPKCETCGNPLRPGGIIYEHDLADGLGGEPTLDNCKVHCKSCAHTKTVKEDNPRMAKADRVLKASFGLKAKKTKLKSRGFAKTPPQRKASSPVDKWRGF
jgi:5-methylcytosine-specific restriction protein A